MKRILITALCAMGLLSAYAEQSDYWKYDGNTSMTDGEWTFTVQMRYDMIDGSIYPIWVKGCTGYPATPTTLDFSKDVVYEADRNYKFAITQIQPGFNGSTAGQSIKVLKLPTHGYPFNIGDVYTVTEGFRNCHNLESVVPFLPDSCTSIGAGTFNGCEKLASPLVWRGGSGMLKPSDSMWGSSYAALWDIFNGTAIPSVDFSESKMEAVGRAFWGCTALKSVKLPPGMTDFNAPFKNCESIELVEFNSVPNTLSGFENCSALKEVRFNHTAPSGSIPAGIYNALDQEIMTYLVLDGSETDKLNAWKSVSADGAINDSSTWSSTYAGVVALEKRPLRLYAALPEQLAVSVGSPAATDKSVSFTVDVTSLGEFASIDLLVQVSKNSDYLNPVYNTTVRSGITAAPASVPVEVTGLDQLTKYYVRVQPTAAGVAQDWVVAEPITTLEEVRPCTLSIAKGEDAESGSGKTGTFVVSRASGDSLGAALTVNYTIDASSTAEAGVHYAALSGKVTIPAGQRSGVIEVTALNFGYVGTKSLTVKLAAGDYEIASGSDTATISVATLSLNSVSVVKSRDADEGEGTCGWFVISRGLNDSVSSPMSVAFTVSGSATAGTTYRALQSPVVIPAGERSVRLRVDPLDDAATASDTTVTVTLTGDGYSVGNASATMTVRNGASFGGWKLSGGVMTCDGWKFKVQANNQSDRKFEDGLYWLYVQDLQAYPSQPSELNFDKVIVNYDEVNQPQAIFEFQQPLKAAAAVLKSVVLPDDDRHPFAIKGGLFEDCSNLETITPFLPKSCCQVTRGAFNNLSKLTNTDLCFYGSDFSESSGWEIIKNCTSITNADFSASTITALRRDCFWGCSSLKAITLPPTIQEFGWPSESDTLNRSPFQDVGGVKLIFTGDRLPLMTCLDNNVSEIEFKAPLAQLQDNAFASYYHMYLGPQTRLTTITFAGPPPATVGENIFSGGFINDSITVYVPNYYRAEWREVADGKKLTKDGGTWTSGGRQKIKTYGESRLNFGIYVH